MSNSSLINYTRISPNRTSPRRNKIDRITIHHMAGNLTVETCGNVFASSSRQASSNYGIGSDGRVGMYVEEKDRAWTSSSSANDNRAVTIEVADNKIGNGWGSSNSAMAKLILLCADICRRNGIARLVYTGNTNGNLTLHKWFASTDCPGAFLESQMPTIASEVNKLLASGATTYTWRGATATGGSTTSSATTTTTSSTSSGKDYIRKAQRYMNNFAGAGLAIDGIWGTNSRKGLVKCLQRALNKDYGKKLAEDGIRGNGTNGALGNHYVKRGETQYLVTAVEIGLMCLNYYNSTVESPGIFGGGLETAVRNFQKAHGLVCDGIAGKNTILKIFALLGC